LESEDGDDLSDPDEEEELLFELVEVWAKAVLLSSRRAAPRAIFFMEPSPINKGADQTHLEEPSSTVNIKAYSPKT
jgi:hypothetical protein